MKAKYTALTAALTAAGKPAKVALVEVGGKIAQIGNRLIKSTAAKLAKRFLRSSRKC